ncbi:MAG: alpha/beta fold hydrolase [Flavobacteriales bacterium]|jgi:pimeloyl-ACP methyl ester carboxylesterase|uniref:alpha/beta fold hydrolase n=1 Tax=Blattabacterium sp. (Mastotermes darwiniensis) TaxID=39768 RepID=UPI000231DF47|nr:alpha/beta fold hydrolase [Blattabacterium sp. (Mastotermes darwiniensis)]AER40867.1 alpha/beta superfamily hydrolase [Blattabacterium sp. (Mastotermes darwiniensis) str. MADAR]MDR1804714.1 alpha/beta fold hydrolase [Flavobacteriales bacterium]
MILHSNIFGYGSFILVLHGLFGSGENWVSFAKEFSKNYQVHLLDIRNHGKSFFSRKMNYDLISEDILEYIRYYNIFNPILIGHSMGGRAVMNFSMTHPLIPKKIVIVDISPKAYTSTNKNKNMNIIPILKSVDFNIINTRKDLDTFLTPLIQDSGIRSFFSKSTYRKRNGKLAFRFFLLGIEKNYFSLIHQKVKDGCYKNPALFLRGEYSDYILPKDYILIKKLFTNAKIITVRKSKHWVHIDNPIDFYKEISYFINEKY